MEYHEYLEVIRQESAALAAAAESVPLETPVPTCRDWDMAGLVTHILQVQQWARLIVATRATERPPRSVLPPPPAPAELVAAFRAATGALVETLATTAPATPVWTWTRERGVSYWARRQAQEVAVHRWDAQAAAGAPGPLAAPLAADGIDELFGLLPFIPGARGGAGETVQLCGTDVPGEWRVRLGAAGLEVERRQAPSDATVRGTASDLDLFLWGRLPVAALEVSGDAALAARLQALTTW